jgi:hypothetical protein
LRKSLLGQVRIACKKVTKKARYVRVNSKLIPSYVASLSPEELRLRTVDPRDAYLGHKDDLIAYVLTLDSINFGSGYFPHLRLTTNTSGYFAIASALKNRFDTKGPLTPQELLNLEPHDCAEIFQQDLQDDSRRELMRLFSSALNDLGSFILDRYEGKFSNLIRQANSSVENLVKILVEMPYFRDVAQYKHLTVPFYKRAQITAADLSLRFNGEGPGFFVDLEHLTIFADNRVPHVLRVDGILSYEDSLAAKIAAGKLIPSGSEEEVEIRASALHAVELIVDHLRNLGREIISMDVDLYLWNRGHNDRYESVPRHLTRTVYY